MLNKKIKIIVVGGGAGGLEVVARLCRQFKSSTKTAEITLIDKAFKHVWKPLYHEVAAGTFNRYQDEIDYLSYSFQKGFKFITARLNEINHREKWIEVTSPGDHGLPLFKQCLRYDILVLSIGSQSNDFNISGVKENCLFLDSLAEAELLNKTLLKHIIFSNAGHQGSFAINIIGGGATGTELAAELNYVITKLKHYTNQTGLPMSRFHITLIEAGSRLLSVLPSRLSTSVSDYLKNNNINVLTHTKITHVTKDGIVTSDNTFIKSGITIWAAGIQGNGSFKHELEVNQLHQFKVKATLQATLDDSIFAFGDCASCPQTNINGQIYYVPPRAQAAHQQASFLINALSEYSQNKTINPYCYKDYGSLISLSRYNVVGYLTNNGAKLLYIDGLLARLAYWLLYRKHLLIIKGVRYLILSTFTDIIMKKQHPEIKLH